MKTVTVNLNDRCTVKLTEVGAARLNADSSHYETEYPNVKAFKNPKQYSNGDQYSCQIHELFSTFGDLVSLGAMVPFGPDIEVPIPEPVEVQGKVG